MVQVIVIPLADDLAAGGAQAEVPERAKCQRPARRQDADIAAPERGDVGLDRGGGVRIAAVEHQHQFAPRMGLTGVAGEAPL
jgi:hypothetical protein